MAFNLQKVLRALLFAANGPLTLKEIQDTLARFHTQESEMLAKAKPAPAAAEQAQDSPLLDPAMPPPEPVAVVEGVAMSGSPAPSDTAAEQPLGLTAAETDPEFYQGVPSLVTASQIREAMDAISADLKARDEVYFLIDGSNGYRLVTNPKAARWVRLLRDEPPPVRLSQAALETLAVIAYRQPVTRSEIEAIRGVSAEAGVNKLLERGLIYVAGRAELPGRPIQFGTTDDFLEFIGVKSLAELPASDVLSNRQIDDWLKQADEAPTVGDREMGLETEQLPLDPPEVEDLPAQPDTPVAPPPAENPTIGDEPTIPPTADQT
jgi:segregation and condensation protein B